VRAGRRPEALYPRNDQRGCLMSPVSKGLASFTVAAALASAASAQGLLTQKNIPLATAQAIASAALTKCESMGFKVSVVVIDRDGLPIVMLRRLRSAHARRRRPQGLYRAHVQPAFGGFHQTDDRRSKLSRLATIHPRPGAARRSADQSGRRCGRRGWRLRITGQGRRLLASRDRQSRGSVELMLPSGSERPFSISGSNRPIRRSRHVGRISRSLKLS
jgi:hypothetical protein